MLAVLAGALFLDRAQRLVPVYAAARDLPAGTVLRRGDLMVLRVRLPEVALRHYLRPSPNRAVPGRVLTAPLRREELVPAEVVLASSRDAGLVELPVQADPGDMAQGLRAGDTVQVVAAFTEGARRGRAVVLLPTAEVVRVLQDPAGLAGAGQERGVQLRMPGDRAPVVAAAIATARIFVVKAPGPATGQAAAGSVPPESTPPESTPPESTTPESLSPGTFRPGGGLDGGKSFTPQKVRELLLSPKTAGLRYVDGRPVTAEWPGIITQQQHEELRAILGPRRRERTSKGPTTVRTYLLGGFLFCARVKDDGKLCGHRLTAKRAGNKRRYACMTRLGGCGGILRAAEPLEQLRRAGTAHPASGAAAGGGQAGTGGVGKPGTPADPAADPGGPAGGAGRLPGRWHLGQGRVPAPEAALAGPPG